MVMPHLLRHVGERMARYLLLTGELIDAEEAVRAGLVNAVVERNQLLTTAQRGRVPWRKAVRAHWRRRRNCCGNFAAIAFRGRICQGSAAPRLTDECRQGLTAFFAKHPAPWAPKSP